MPSELPIACSLSAAELRARLREMADLGRTALLDIHHEPTRADLRFVAGTGVRDRVERIVAAESHCCAFLTMSVSGEPDTIVLSIEAPDGAELVLQELLAAFRGQPSSAPARRKRARRSPLPCARRGGAR